MSRLRAEARMYSCRLSSSHAPRHAVDDKVGARIVSWPMPGAAAAERRAPSAAPRFSRLQLQLPRSRVCN